MEESHFAPPTHFEIIDNGTYLVRFLYNRLTPSGRFSPLLAVDWHIRPKQFEREAVDEYRICTLDHGPLLSQDCQESRSCTEYA